MPVYVTQLVAVSEIYDDLIARTFQELDIIILIDWLIAWLIEVSWEKQNRMKVGQINGDKQLRVNKVVVFIILLFRLEVLRYSKAQKL
jgi:hypothetical protein